jgi:hypothetical protein
VLDVESGNRSTGSDAMERFRPPLSTNFQAAAASFAPPRTVGTAVTVRYGKRRRRRHDAVIPQ